jgi:hypothetical protein
MAESPKAENGVLFLGAWSEDAKALVAARWPKARVTALGQAMRIDLSDAPRGACPGMNDGPAIGALSLLQGELGETARPRVAIGFYCDAVAKAEGFRLFDSGRERDRRKVDWATANPPDPVAWPIGSLALTLGLPVSSITSVVRPPRPPLAVALEAVLNGEEPSSPELRHQAVQLLGSMDIDVASDALGKQVRHEDWVTRFHAVRAYARLHRKPGQGKRPRLDALLADEDEGVREAALQGILELLPRVEFQDKPLHEQIDAAVVRGLADPDEDVRAAAAKVKDLRRELLG